MRVISTTPAAITTPNMTTTTYRPFNARYQRKNITGLLCQTGAAEFLSVQTPDACDFFIVEFATNPARPHPVYSYMATVDITSLAQQIEVVNRIRVAANGALLLLVQRSVLHSFTPDSGLDPRAVVRGLVQLVVDTNAHGVVLADRHLHESDLQQVFADANDLSNEIYPYHGLIRYDKYSGQRAELRSLLAKVSNMPHLTFVFRVSGLSRTFTHPYFNNLYMENLNQQNLSWIIDEDVVRPLMTIDGRKSVALSMSLMARSCPENTIIKADTMSECSDMPLDLTRICMIYPAFLQANHWSVMTRRYNGARDDGLTRDMFFETSDTFSTKAYMMAKQIKRSGADPFTFILERYDLEPQEEIYYEHPEGDRNVLCEAKTFGFTNKTKAKLMTL
ncbi:uncharacterized protein LOC119440221 [Dermacentor silvarum]|uniref:uncharacterized protein LOC119440221 n=1 Tax=Dermacentor silvarum TaxID=543639 RepID=UPI002100AB09|nr:uncharacterized protein LOC119440221 [Dermacentor silvarum]